MAETYTPKREDIIKATERTRELIDQLEEEGMDGLDASVGVMRAITQNLSTALSPGTNEYGRCFRVLLRTFMGQENE